MSGCKERQKLAQKYTERVSEWSRLVASLKAIEVDKYSKALKSIDAAKKSAQEAMETYMEHVKEHSCN